MPNIPILILYARVLLSIAFCCLVASKSSYLTARWQIVWCISERRKWLEENVLILADTSSFLSFKSSWIAKLYAVSVYLSNAFYALKDSSFNPRRQSMQYWISLSLTLRPRPHRHPPQQPCPLPAWTCRSARQSSSISSVCTKISFSLPWRKDCSIRIICTWDPSSNRSCMVIWLEIWLRHE